MLTASQYLVDKDGLQWKSLKASLDMLAATLVPLHQVGLVAHFGMMSSDNTVMAIHRKMDYRDITSMRPWLRMTMIFKGKLMSLLLIFTLLKEFVKPF